MKTLAITENGAMYFKFRICPSNKTAGTNVSMYKRIGMYMPV